MDEPILAHCVMLVAETNNPCPTPSLETEAALSGESKPAGSRALTSKIKAMLEKCELHVKRTCLSVGILVLAINKRSGDAAMAALHSAPRKILFKGLNHVAWRCIDAEQTRQFYEDFLGLPLAHVIRSEHVPATGEYAPYCHLFFEMRDGSYIAYFDIRDGRGATLSSDMPK
jgi:Glyoxalase/Bleomycin resistance protein/Dioxygenase superfamily